MGATRSWQQLAEEVVSTNMQRSRYRDASVGLSVMNWVSLGTERAEDGWMDTPTCFPDQQVEGGGGVFLHPSMELGHQFTHPELPQPPGDARRVLGLPGIPAARSQGCAAGLCPAEFWKMRLHRAMPGHWDNSSSAGSGPAGLFLCSGAMRGPHGCQPEGYISQERVGQTLFLSSANSLEK